MQQINRPGILGVWLDGDRKLPHAVALLALTETTATIADPARGQLFYLDRATFAQVWRHQYVPIFRPQAQTTIDTLQQAGKDLKDAPRLDRFPIKLTRKFELL